MGQVACFNAPIGKDTKLGRMDCPWLVPQRTEAINFSKEFIVFPMVNDFTIMRWGCEVLICSYFSTGYAASVGDELCIDIIDPCCNRPFPTWVKSCYFSVQISV